MAIAPTIHDIREITPVLSDKFKIDFSNYAFSFLRRRFAHIFNVLNVKSTKDFIEKIKSGELTEDFSYHFPVPDTEMFRDPSFWRYLRLKILPGLEEDKFSFWFPQLVSCEELFSLLVILKEEGVIDKAKVYCNVSSAKKLEEIKSGITDSKKIELNKQNFKRLELNHHFEDYFINEDGKVFIDKSLMTNVEFLKGNFFNEVPNTTVSFVIFRNRMIYYNAKLQVNAEEILAKYIHKGGYMAIGIKERISQANQSLFDEYEISEKIYKV
ncbi:hypothetical protein E9993_05555 [Labilibacter sediminis]|nr:hypothetical protein E9993_05555 [Labilibacter sediminis]